ncbi:unnamed protein product [Cunninghamella blakesleeana]
MKVPNNKVGLVIGRGGDTLKKIERNSGARVQIDQDTGDDKRVIKLSGEQDQIQIARDMIDQIIRDALASSSSHSNDAYGPSSSSSSHHHHYQDRNNNNNNSNNNNSDHHDGSSVLIPVPGNRVGLVIGRGGDTIRELERKSGARIKVLLDRPGNAPNEKLVSISGDHDAIENAKKLVYDIVNNQPYQNRSNYGNDDGPNKSYDDHSDKVTIPKEFVGLVIGRGGETVRQLKAESGARIIVDKYDNTNSDKKTFILQGSPDSIEKARQLIMEKVESGQNARNDDRRGSGGYRNGGGGRRDYRGQDYNSGYQGDGYNNKNDYYQQDQQYDYSQYQDYYSQQSQQQYGYDQYGQQQQGSYDQYGQQQNDTQYNNDSSNYDQYQTSDSNNKGTTEPTDNSQYANMSQKEIQDATEAYYAQYYGQQPQQNKDSQSSDQPQQQQQEWTQEAYNQWYQQYYGNNTNNDYQGNSNNNNSNSNNSNNNDQYSYSNDYYNQQHSQQQYNNNDDYSKTTNEYHSSNDKPSSE